MGPLAGVKVVEIASLGPGPWAAMMLSDLGAEVIRVDRASDVDTPEDERPIDYVNRRGRRSLAVDLKHPDGVDVVLTLAARSDVVIEGARPGVAERLGIGPEPCLRRNPRLIYGRMTGWGQDGPLAQVPGHDLNYIGITGLLHAIGQRDGPPTPPLSLVGDYGGGGMLLLVGILSALWEVSRSGAGQVIDAAMIDGAALLGSLVYGWRQSGLWEDTRESNFLDGGAPFCRTYETADGRWVAVSATESRFYGALVEALGLAATDLPPQYDRSSWPRMRAVFAEIFRTRTREEWVDAMRSVEACFSPVLTIDEAMSDEHMTARGTFVDVDGVRQPAPAPRFSRTPAEIASSPARAGEHTGAVLRDWGFSAPEIVELTGSGAVRESQR